MKTSFNISPQASVGTRRSPGALFGLDQQQRTFNEDARSYRTAQSLLQKPDYEEGDFDRHLSQYINNYSGILADHFLERINPEKLKKLFKKETSPSSFRTGMAK